ncbi:bifunctional DNA primase/polymerase [Pseudonocardia sp. ICBG601]|uniref:bifunctional DNA primase/polymerase n=1 Tax=Pseudonocardia sp. ICBG601 TaxID=2846759 RepID=UPI0027E2759F|nr:bifunctional DNA primase/polymerase [Pseudonocardia sp. ICBG601]
MSATDRARLAGWLDLAARGWALFPVLPGRKQPAIPAWESRATTDERTIVDYFRTHPGHNAGIACGPSGLYVLDCDTPKPDAPDQDRDGWDVLTGLADGRGGLPDTWTVTTPSGGRHLYFRAPATRLGNTAKSLGPMLDSRGHGGQVLAPGSRLPNGAYELADDTDPPPLPGWLVWHLSVRGSVAVSGPRVSPCTAPRDHGAYVAAIVRAELQRVAEAGRGGHNAAVFTAARALGQLVGARVLDEHQAAAELTAAAGHIVDGPCDCTPSDIAATIASGSATAPADPAVCPPVEHHLRGAAVGMSTTAPQGLRAVRDLPAVAPAVLLDQVTAFVSRFSVFPDRHTGPMLALWYAPHPRSPALLHHPTTDPGLR